MRKVTRGVKVVERLMLTQALTFCTKNGSHKILLRLHGTLPDRNM